MIGIDTGNTAWVLIAAAMVFFMTPGLALFYGGMARSKNVLSTIMQSFFLIGVISVEFMLIGYTLIFGDDVHGIIGSLNKIGLMGTENSIYCISMHVCYYHTSHHERFYYGTYAFCTLCSIRCDLVRTHL